MLKYLFNTVKFRLITLFAAIAAIASAHGGNPVTAQIDGGPWLQAVGESEFTVVWTTNVESACWVEAAPDDGTHFYFTERPKYYQSHFGRRPVGKLHAITVDGLEKGKTYRYRIFQQALLVDEGNKRVILGNAYGSDILKHKPFTVRTADPERPELNFRVVNDIHGNDSLFRALVRDVKGSEIDFVVFNGDMLTQIESEEQIMDGYLKSATELFASEIPFYHARGNHENRGTFSYRYMDYFPTSTGQPYYVVRNGPLCMVVLDSGEDKPDSDIRYYGLSLSDWFREEQAEWLSGVVESDAFRNAPVRIVVIHMPPATDNWHGRSEVARLFVPILNDAGVDLMLSGHTHRYSYIEGGELCNFPILINSNTERVDLKVTAKKITAKTYDAAGKTLKTHEITVPKR